MCAKYVVILCIYVGCAMAAPTSNSIEDPLKIISRREWGARKPKQPATPLTINPPDYVVMHHSATPSCFSKEKCIRSVKAFQNYHMDTHKWNDIGYNFVVGEDGNIYEGRGWGKTGAHATIYNSRSIGICIVGTFTDHLPNELAINAVNKLISYGILSGYIDPFYKLIGHRQATATECPGDALFDQIKTWDHWTPSYQVSDIDVRHV